MLLHQRHKELAEIRQKSDQFITNIVHLQADADRILHMIGQSPNVRLNSSEKKGVEIVDFCFQTAEDLVSEIDSTFSALQYLGRDLKKSLDVLSSTDIDRELKSVASSVDSIHDSLERAKKSQEVILFFI